MTANYSTDISLTSTSTTFDSTYSVEDYSYPIDLFSSNQYGNNYVIFYINVSVDSTLLANNDNSTVDISQSSRNRGLLLREAANLGLSSSGLADANFILNGGNVLSNFLGIKSGTSSSSSIINQATTNFSVSSTGKSSRATKRLKAAIALNIPNDIKTSYSTQWDEESTFAMSAVLGAGNSLMNAAAKKGKLTTDNFFDRVPDSILQSVALRTGTDSQRSGLSALQGVAVNPRREQIFKGVDYRTFTFTYQFFPRNEDEAKNVDNIIKMFKLHMMPEYKDDSAFLYIYPSEFDIEYMHGSDQNRTLHKQTSCALTNIDVNYSPNGNFATFANGQPVQTDITLTFKELGLLTKKDIERGY